MSSPLARLRFRADHRWTPGHLSAYVDGELAARAGQRLRRHIRECPECRYALRSLERMLDVLHRVPPVEADETRDIAAAVRRRLREPSARHE